MEGEYSLSAATRKNRLANEVLQTHGREKKNIDATSGCGCQNGLIRSGHGRNQRKGYHISSTAHHGYEKTPTEKKKQSNTSSGVGGRRQAKSTRRGTRLKIERKQSLKF